MRHGDEGRVVSSSGGRRRHKLRGVGARVGAVTHPHTDPAAAVAPSDLAPLSPLFPGAEAAPGTEWGMQIAVRYDKVHPARRVDVAEAAARAVVILLASPEAAPGGPWHEAVRHWCDNRIRKLVRRARGRRWDEIQELPGTTVTQDGPRGWAPAAARALVPGPVRPLPPSLAKTQVEGTHFPDGDALPPPPAAVTAAVRRAEDAGEGSSGLIALGSASTSSGALVTVEVTPLHEMTSGKLCAQVAHAAQLAWQSPDLPTALRDAWAEDGYRVRVVPAERQTWESALRPVRVVDAGFTELGAPTETTRAYW